MKNIKTFTDSLFITGGLKPISKEKLLYGTKCETIIIAKKPVGICVLTDSDENLCESSFECNLKRPPTTPVPKMPPHGTVCVDFTGETTARCVISDFITDMLKDPNGLPLGKDCYSAEDCKLWFRSCRLWDDGLVRCTSVKGSKSSDCEKDEDCEVI